MYRLIAIYGFQNSGYHNDRYVKTVKE